MSTSHLIRAADTMRGEEHPFFDAVADLLTLVDQHRTGHPGPDTLRRSGPRTVGTAVDLLAAAYLTGDGAAR